MLTYLLVAFYAVIGIQCIYYLIFTTPILFKNKKQQSISVPISIIICAKNEAENLSKFLPSIIAQKYSNTFEIVLINDRSTDNTSEIIEKFAQENNFIKVVKIEDCENFWGNKKYALTLGIKAATYEHLLFTDADCKPKHKTWIEEMSTGFSKEKNIVLGYGGYSKTKGSFLNKIIRFETILTAVQYFSYAKIGLPYMGVGRNLAYTKTDFFNVNGFIKHIKIKSGDDDLFINEIATSKNTAICLDENGFTTSVPKKTFKEWIRQKRRHISTSHHYKLKHKLLLVLFYLSQVSFFILSILLLVLMEEKQLILLLITLRYLVTMTSLSLFSRKLKEKDLIWILPFAEITLIFCQLYIYLKNKSTPPVEWD